MSKLQTEQRDLLEQEYEDLIRQGGPKEGQTDDDYAKALYEKSELVKLYEETDGLHSILTSAPDVRGDYSIADVKNTDAELGDAEDKSKASNEAARQKKRKIVVGIATTIFGLGAVAASGGSFSAAVPGILAAAKMGFNALSTTQ